MSETRMKILALSESTITLQLPDGKPLADMPREGAIVYLMADEDGAESDGEITEAESRLRKSARWATRARNLMADVAANMNLASHELIGPEAKQVLIDHCGGDKQAAAAALYTAKEQIADVEKAVKGGRDSAKSAGEVSEHLLWAIDRHHVELLSGQTSIDEVKEGRHRDTKPARKRKGDTATAQQPEAPATAQETAPAELIPWARLRAWKPDDSPIEGDDLLAFLTAWREGKDQVGLLVPFRLIDSEDGSVEVLIDFERRRCAADKVAQVEQEAVKRDGSGTETVERVVLCTPELVDWTGCPGYTAPERLPAWALMPAQRAEAEARGLTPEQINSIEAARRADPGISQVQLSKVTGIERTKLIRVLKAGE